LNFHEGRPQATPTDHDTTTGNDHDKEEEDHKEEEVDHKDCHDHDDGARPQPRTPTTTTTTTTPTTIGRGAGRTTHARALDESRRGPLNHDHNDHDDRNNEDTHDHHKTEETIAFLEKAVKLLREVAKKEVEKDKTQWQKDVILRAELAHNEGDARTLHSCFKKLRKYVPKPPPLIHDSTGKPAATPILARKAWREHFGKALDGKEVTFEEIFEEADAKDKENWKQQPPSEMTYIPAEVDVTRLCKKLKAHRATGVDALVP
jgi:hypothetical protein